jgi:hypothetical protein
MQKTVKIRKPRVDDELLWNILFAVWGTPAVFVAYQLNLYALLAERPRTLEQICDAKGLKRRPAEAILSVTTSLGITRLRGSKYALTPAGEDYFVETSPSFLEGNSTLRLIIIPHGRSKALSKP